MLGLGFYSDPVKSFFKDLLALFSFCRARIDPFYTTGIFFPSSFIRQTAEQMAGRMTALCFCFN